MTLEEARLILELGLSARKREIRAAYRRAARRWHPDRAPEDAADEYRSRMQAINAAYQRVMQFLDDYTFELVEPPAADDYQDWWLRRFGGGSWGPPEKPSGEEK